MSGSVRGASGDGRPYRDSPFHTPGHADLNRAAPLANLNLI